MKNKEIFEEQVKTIVLICMKLLVEADISAFMDDDYSIYFKKNGKDMWFKVSNDELSTLYDKQYDIVNG